MSVLWNAMRMGMRPVSRVTRAPSRSFGSSPGEGPRSARCALRDHNAYMATNLSRAVTIAGDADFSSTVDDTRGYFTLKGD